jgi:DNA-binding transcriptional ArsR family regulator
MESKAAIRALSALAHDTRLAVFRLLVQAGPDGVAAGRLAAQLGIAAPTLSFHLSHLNHAGLVEVQRIGRSLIYRADYSCMNGLVAFLTENCCGGLGACAPVCVPDRVEEKIHEAPARSRRR